MVATIAHPAQWKGIDNGYEFRDYDEYGTKVSGFPNPKFQEKIS